METQITSLNNQEFALKSMVLREREADIDQYTVRLNEGQYPYHATFQGGAKMMDRSLMDYLR